MNSLRDGKPSEADFVLTRAFSASRELVFKAWTDCTLFSRWWGPRGFETSFCTVDARPGGLLRYSMRSPHGRVYWGRGIFCDVVEPERIVFLDAFSDERGEVVEPSVYGLSADWPTETTVDVTFVKSDGGTIMTLHSDVLAPLAEAQGARQGWEESLDKLAELLDELMSANA